MPARARDAARSRTSRSIVKAGKPMRGECKRPDYVNNGGSLWHEPVGLPPAGN